MDYREEGHRLVISASESERRELEEAKLDRDEWESDDFMRQFLEPIVANSELQWLSPSDTGDMTDAPTLGVLGDPVTDIGNYGYVDIGDYARLPIVKRWCYMDYQVKTPLEDLLERGRVVFVS